MGQNAMPKAWVGVIAGVVLACSTLAAASPLPPGRPIHREHPGDTPAPPLTDAGGMASKAMPPSVQVNVDASGKNIPGDAANEPSIAVDPANGSRIAIGWRQFDSVSSNFRQAGYAYSTDGGRSFRFPGVLTPGSFRSDPVLYADGSGTFYYYSLTVSGDDFACSMFRSNDGGATWGSPIPAFGGDKAWMAIDRTGGPGRGAIYIAWSNQAGCCGDAVFTRSFDGGATYETPTALPGNPIFGTLSVSQSGKLFLTGVNADTFAPFIVLRASNPWDRSAPPVWDLVTSVDLGGPMVGGGVNPAGLLGQAWIAAHGSSVYVLCAIGSSGGDPTDVMFARSDDEGATFRSPIRVNDDVPGAWQWFGTLAVAGNGRIDAVWYDTRNDPASAQSQLFYAASLDGGSSFSQNRELSPPFRQSVGYPNQNKIGDYITMVSDDAGADVAYAATFNGEQDVYFLRVTGIPGYNADVDRSGLVDGWDLILLALSFGKQSSDPGYSANADIDHSGTVDGADLAILAASFGQSA